MEAWERSRPTLASPGNLAVMSTRANRAKSGYGCEDAMAFARQVELLGKLGQIDGLSAEHWARIAVLVSFVTPMPHARAVALPLRVLPPARLRVLNPVQSLQVMLSLQFTRAGHGRRCAALASLMPSAEALHAFKPFMLTLLARRVAAGQIADPLAERHAVEDMWKDPLVNRRWQRLALRLTAEDCERIGRVAAERGLAGSGVLWLKDEAATEGWALGSGGYAVERVGKVAAVDCPPRLASAAFGPAMGQGAWRDGNGVARFAQAVNDR